MINVEELITDPDFSQPDGINIIRSQYEIVEHEPVITETKIRLEGVITINNDKSNIMTPEADRNEEQINVFTKQNLYVTGMSDKKQESYISDMVIWNGYRYKVYSVRNNIQYGYSKAACSRLRQDVV